MKGNQINSQQNQKINAKTFAGKCKTKKEIYLLLTIDAKAFLPKCDCLTTCKCMIYLQFNSFLDFLKDLIAGVKKFILANEMVHLTVPQYEGLTLDDILEKWKGHQTLMQYLPIEREIIKLPKQFVINVCYKIIGHPFDVWVKAKINERNAKLEEKQNLLISVDPRIAAVFNNSTFMSCKF